MKVKIRTLPSNNLLFRGNDYQVITPINQILKKLGPIFISTQYTSPLTSLNILFFEAHFVMYFYFLEIHLSCAEISTVHKL